MGSSCVALIEFRFRRFRAEGRAEPLHKAPSRSDLAQMSVIAGNFASVRRGRKISCSDLWAGENPCSDGSLPLPYIYRTRGYVGP